MYHYDRQAANAVRVRFRVEQTGRGRVSSAGCWGTSSSQGIGTMLHVRWNTNIDARRSISLLMYMAGCAVAALGMAASPEPLAFGLYGVAVAGVLGAAIGGYRRHRVSDHEHAPLWALANGALVAAILVATFGTAVVIRPT